MTVRYTGVAYPGGMLVLDTFTGRVVRVPADGSAPAVLLDASGGPELAAPAPPAQVVVPAPGDALDREVVSTFPYPVARTWQRFVVEADPRQRCRLLVDAFTSVLKLWALQTASEYLRAADVRDAAVNKTLERDFARPLISAWNLMLFRGLPVLRDAGVVPFAPELPRAYEALETKCRDPVQVEVHYEDAQGEPRTKRSKLGKIQALIRYRNGLAHGYNQSRAKAEEDLERYLPVLRDVLAAGRFMARYPLMYAAARTRGGLRAFRMMGAEPSGEPVELRDVDVDPARSPLFLYDEARAAALPLYVFLDVDAVEAEREAARGLGRDVALYEGRTRSTVIYASVGGAHVEKQSRAKQWRELLAPKSVDAKVLRRGDLSVGALRDAAARQHRATLDRLIESNKYVPETTVTRSAVEAVLARFEAGDHRGLVLGGHGGMGKTTLLAQLVERRRDAGEVVLFYRGSSLADTELSMRILRDLHVSGMYFEDFLAAADPCFADGGRMRIVVDAVDEHPDDAAALVRAIDAIVRQAGSYPWLRVVASVRESAYRRLGEDARFGSTGDGRYLRVERARGDATERSPIVDVEGFTGEELAEVYARYRAYRRPDPDAPDDEGVHVFRPLTPFAALDPDGATCALMRTPLMLRLILAAFHRRELPSQISFDQAMRLYVDHVVLERDRPTRPYPERQRFLRGLVEQLDARKADAVAVDQLYAVDRLRAALQNPQKDSPYVQLLDLGVLMEEWEGDVCRVRFAFGGMLEYLLAERHDARIERPEQLLAAAGHALEYKSLRKALGILVRRALEQRRAALPAGALELAEGHPAGDLLESIVADVIAELGRFRDPSFEDAVAPLERHPSPAAVRALDAAFDELFAFGDTARAEHVARIAAEVADAVGAPRARASTGWRLGQVAQRRGDNAAALETYAEARALAGASDAPVLAARIDLWRAQILVDRGALAEARTLAADAYEAFDAAGATADAAEARRIQSTIEMRAEDRSQQLVHLEASIALSEEAGDPVRAAKALNNLAMARAEDGEDDEAERAYLRALERFEAQGDLTSGGVVQLNLANLYSGRMGRLDRSREALERAIASFEAAEHHLGMALAVNHLGTLHLLSGELDEARACFERALALYRAREEPTRIAYALWFLGTVAAEGGARAEAEAIAARLEAVVEGLDATQPRVHRAALALRVAVLNGDPDGVSAAIAALEAVADPDAVARWDLEDGPCLAYLAAAAFFDARGDTEPARRACARADACAARRPFHRREALEALVTRLGLRPAVNVGVVGES